MEDLIDEELAGEGEEEEKGDSKHDEERNNQLSGAECPVDACVLAFLKVKRSINSSVEKCDCVSVVCPTVSRRSSPL